VDQPLVPDGENILRAVFSNECDNQRGPFSSVFTGGDVSVSRPRLIPLNEHWGLFRRHVQKPPQRMLLFFLEINVAHLRDLGRNHTAKPTEIHVEEQPCDWNPAHARIVEDLPKGLAKKIIKECSRHDPPSWNTVSY
jgi:hypothetical protein